MSAGSAPLLLGPFALLVFLISSPAESPATEQPAGLRTTFEIEAEVLGRIEDAIAADIEIGHAEQARTSTTRPQRSDRTG